jgi:tRNA modification GTPase
VRKRCEAGASALQALLDESTRFERLSHEPRVVLVGRPNAGKSTLLNALAGRDRAVVSNVAGTTRDAIWAEVKLARGMIKLVDVAGIEEAATAAAAAVGDSAQASIARQMHEQAIREIATADLVVLVEELPIQGGAIRVERRPDLVVRSKSDLAAATAEEDRLTISAKTGAGLDALRAALDRLAFGTEAAASGLALNARHVRALAEARDALGRAKDSTGAGAEVVAMELREALDALGGVLGRVSPDDLLGRIFSQFCMGK